MTRIASRPFREAHADVFKCAPDHLERFRDLMPIATALGKVDQCGIHVLDGRILYVSGWYQTAPGVVEGFIFPSIFVYESLSNKKAFLAEAKWFVARLKSQNRRVQCWGEDTEVSKKWLKALGFKLEGELKSFTTDGSSMLIWGMTE